MRLLIDENLSPRLARWACDMGIPAEAAVHVGLAGAADEDVFAHALAWDQIVVTVNVGDASVAGPPATLDVVLTIQDVNAAPTGLTLQATNH